MYSKIRFRSTEMSAPPDFGEEWRQDVDKRLKAYGLDIDEFTGQVRDFFAEAQRHHYRLVFRDAMAQCLGLDMAKPADRDLLWRQIADGIGVDRKARGRWLTGEVDPPLDSVMLYLGKLRVKCNPPLSNDVIAPVRTGVARTLTYIRVFPPNRPKCELPDADSIPTALEKCWDRMRRHVHFRKRRDLNQHAIDGVGHDFGDCLWLESSEIGKVKDRIESSPTGKDPLFWPWGIFKFSTTESIISTNRAKTNPHEWIWDDSHPSYGNTWSV